MTIQDNRQFTHRKRPYHAEAVKWDGSNYDAIKALIPQAEKPYFTAYGNGYIAIRTTGRLDTLAIGDWVVRGENGQVKCYKPEAFESKYEALTPLVTLPVVRSMAAALGIPTEQLAKELASICGRKG